MDRVVETPLKRRKTETGHVSGQSSYNSQDDSPDDLYTDYASLAHKDAPAFPSSYVTQPTQLIGELAPLSDGAKDDEPTVQVAASSPIKPSTIPAAPTSQSGGILASAMAPPGTAFRAPNGIRQPPPLKKKIVIDLSDDEGMKYQGPSSDEDTQKDRRDIQPSVLKSRKAEVQGAKKFDEIMKNAVYAGPKPTDNKGQGLKFSGSVFDSRNRDEGNISSKINVAKRPADVLANSYGSVRQPTKKLVQTKPAKAQPVQDITFDDIPDYHLRKKAERLKDVVPTYSIRLIKEALIQKGGHEDDAMDLLVSKEPLPEEVDLTKSSEDELAKDSPAKPKMQAKQQLKIPARTIKEKYGFQSQAQARPSKPEQADSSPASPPPAKPRRRLMKGRKQRSKPSSPVLAPQRSETPVSISSDSGVASEADDDKTFDGDLLGFFNTCSLADLCDLAAIKTDIAKLIISRRPFKTLNQVRKVSDVPAQNQASTKKSTKRPIGERIVDVCERMWSGYQAVDQLVRRCTELGKPVANEMKEWGVDVFGASKDGELALTSFENDGKTDPSLRDSGIGTPTSYVNSASEDGDEGVRKASNTRGKQKTKLLGQPSIMSKDVTLKDYQIVGVNWLALLFENKLSCILADDMGLGKTCQVVGFLAHLKEKGVKGPHLIIVPGSTLENWLREFRTFCDVLKVMPYYGNAQERREIAYNIMEEDPDVIVTTYTVSKPKADRKFLDSLRPTVCVYDEGHQLKNSKSKAYEELMKVKTKFRLLLTGTPLQNNLIELSSLLGFILPEVFNEHREDLEAIFSHKAKTTDESHTALLSAQRIARARSMMTPFILRRKKHQVLKHLPPKTRRVEYCDMTTSQMELYEAEKAKHRQAIADRAAGIKPSKDTNVLMALRQAAIHPLLFRRVYDLPTLTKMAKIFVSQPEFRDRDEFMVYEDMTVMNDFELHRFCTEYAFLSHFALQDSPWMDSGKVTALCALLRNFQAAGDRVLIFSQFRLVMDILEEVLQTVGVKFFRLDGNTPIDTRQDLLDQFYADATVTAFMLSTKAGGAGINLACANKVVVFDASFNPQDDVQAENRAHRVGQTREVEVVRLVARGTVEEQIHALGESKMKLDERVAGETGEMGMEVDEEKKMVEEMLVKELEMPKKEAPPEGKVKEKIDE